MIATSIILFVIVILLLYFYRLRSRAYQHYKENQHTLSAEQIYRHLCCLEFPFECFYGINLAFYRTFVSPTISTIYTQTNTIVGETEKRVNDTDIIMHAWIDYGLDSDEGRASMQLLNQIHGVFTHRTRNEDFIFILCCFTVDTIRIIDVFGWRQLDEYEKRAIFEFYDQVGKRMNLIDRPTSLEEAYEIVKNYIEYDVTSCDTEKGRILTESIHKLVVKWYGLLLPAFLTRSLLNGVLYIVGGPTFHRKLGLSRPSIYILSVVHLLVRIRRWIMTFAPPRSQLHRLSDLLMQMDYKCPVTYASFTQVGPPKITKILQ